jgi:hypothetical protein
MQQKPEVAASIPRAERESLLRFAGEILSELSEHTTPFGERTHFGSMPAPEKLRTSTVVLDALKRVAGRVPKDVDTTRLGDESYADVRAKLLSGVVPSDTAQASLISLFTTVRRLASHRDYRPSMNDAR